MAIPSTQVWEVRTTGTATAGGGFDPSVTSPGTDYSVQDAAQVSYADLVIGATTTQLTSAANPFTSAHVGNMIQVASGTGFTVGFYSVRSVSGGVATMDRPVGTAASTAGVGKLGGALAMPGQAMLAAVAGNTVWVKAGTYTQTATITLTSSGPPAIAIKGYGTARGDSGALPVMTTATNAVTLLTSNGAVGWSFSRVAFSHTAGTRGKGLDCTAGGATNFTFSACTFDGFTTAINGSFSANYSFGGVIEGCEIRNQSGTGNYLLLGGPCLLLGNYLHDNPGTAISWDNIANGGPVHLIGNLFKGNGKDVLASIAWNGPGMIVLNNDFISTTGDALKCSNNGAQATILNNLFDAVGGTAINYSGSVSGQSITLVRANAFRACGANYAGLAAGVGDVTLTVSPFANAAGGDYSPNATAGGGASLRAIPRTLPGLSTTSYPDIGAVQHVEPTTAEVAAAVWAYGNRTLTA
jgi:hypothetical protein